MEMKTAGYGLEQENELTCHVPTGQKINKSLRIMDSSDIWSFSKNLKSLWTLNPCRHLWLRCAWIGWSFLELREALRYRCAEANSSPARAGFNPPPPGQKATLCLSKRIQGDGGAVNKLRLLAPHSVCAVPPNSAVVGKGCLDSLAAVVMLCHVTWYCFYTHELSPLIWLEHQNSYHSNSNTVL